MKLYWNRGDYDWQPERYKYSVEQMMLTLFPGERPEYPEEPAGAGEDWARFAVTPGEKWVTVIAQVAREGRQAQGRARFPREKLDEPAEKVYHTVQHGLKMAFYRAGVTLLGQEPPWGALTGVRPVKLPTRAMLAGATPRQAQRELERDFRVSPVRASLAVDCAKASLAVDREVRDDQVSVYIGVPFCPTRCAYCSFVSADVGRTLKLVEPYLEGVLREIAVTGESLRRAGKTVHSLYVGGGTPTTLSASQLSQLLEAVHRDLPVEHCVEYTVEAGRPDTIDREKLLALREAAKKLGGWRLLGCNLYVTAAATAPRISWTPTPWPGRWALSPSTWTSSPGCPGTALRASAAPSTEYWSWRRRTSPSTPWP